MIMVFIFLVGIWNGSMKITEIGNAFKDKKTVRQDHLILLMHDEMFRNEFDGKENFGALITALKKEGYKIGKLTDYVK